MPITIIDKIYNITTQPIIPINELRKIATIPIIAGTTKDPIAITKLQFTKFWFPLVTTLQSSLLMITIDGITDPINQIDAGIQIQTTDESYVSHAIAPFNNPATIINPFTCEEKGRTISYESVFNIWFLNKETTQQDINKTNIHLSYALTYNTKL